MHDRQTVYIRQSLQITEKRAPARPKQLVAHFIQEKWGASEQVTVSLKESLHL